MPRLSPSAVWRDRFARNATAPRPIPWGSPVRWTPDERRAVAASVREFQLGEQSEGRHLQRCADRYAARTGDAPYAEAMRLFIGEEARHAAELARLLASAGERLAARSALDSVFRVVRKLGPGDGLEVCLRVLVAAEGVAVHYYAALRDATGCPVTRALCAQILRDEAAHVRFHAERLARLQSGRGAVGRRAVRAAHRVLMASTAGAVWLGPHRRVLRRGGLSGPAFFRACFQTLDVRVLRVEAAADRPPTATSRLPETRPRRASTAAR